MSVQILGKGKKVALKRRHARLRKHISGTPELPRLVVTRSNRHMVAQIIDDTKGVTLVSESTLTSDFAGFEGTKTEAAKKVGELIAKKAQDAGITAIVAATSIMAASQLSLKAPAREVWHCERQRKGNPSG